MATGMKDYRTHDTKQQILPYRFQMTATGKLMIVNVKGQTLFVSQAEVVNILAKTDLDVHRRKMYEAAMVEFEKAEKQAVH